MQNNSKYEKLAEAKIQNDRYAVISRRNEDGFTIAQRVKIQDGTGDVDVFLKGAIHVDDIEGLYNLRDALNTVLGKNN